MFIPKIYQSKDRELMKQIINKNGFAMLISSKGKIKATHAMMILNNDNKEQFHIETHLSKSNPQGKNLENGDEVLCDFLGAHTYISSSWYNHLNVSTWNYEAVQIYGKIEKMNDIELYEHLKKLTYQYESTQKCPVLVENMDENFVKKEMKGAIGYKIHPTEIFIKQKLSQNRNKEDFDNIIKNLSHLNDDHAKEIAEKMLKIDKI